MEEALDLSFDRLLMMMITIFINHVTSAWHRPNSWMLFRKIFAVFVQNHMRNRKKNNVGKIQTSVMLRKMVVYL